MHMTFWLGYNITNLLFENLHVSSSGGLLLACICTFGFAMFYESLKVSLAAVKFNSAIRKVPKRQQCFTDDMVLIDNKSFGSSGRHLWTATEIMIYSLELTFGYIIMLLVMTYNFYLIISLLLAAGLCYFLFGNRLMEIKMKTSKLKLPCEHCAKQTQKSSMTSSTEVITESVADTGDGTCCTHSNADVHYTS